MEKFLINQYRNLDFFVSVVAAYSFNNSYFYP